MTNMEPWAKEWLEKQRNTGVKCLEVKRRGTKYYVYHSTTHWDKKSKKAIKTSKYLGKLDREKGLIKSQERHQNRSTETRSPEIKSVMEYGNSALLHEAMKDLEPLLT